MEILNNQNFLMEKILCGIPKFLVGRDLTKLNSIMAIINSLAPNILIWIPTEVVKDINNMLTLMRVTTCYNSTTQLDQTSHWKKTHFLCISMGRKLWEFDRDNMREGKSERKCTEGRGRTFWSFMIRDWQLIMVVESIMLDCMN